MPHPFARSAKGAWQNFKPAASSASNQPPQGSVGAASLCAVRKGCVARCQTLPSRPTVRNDSARSPQKPLQSVTHRTRHSCAPSPAASGRQPARVRHPQLPPQRQTQKPINFTVNCRSGIIHSSDTSRRTNRNSESHRAEGCATRPLSNRRKINKGLRPHKHTRRGTRQQRRQKRLL